MKVTKFCEPDINAIMDKVFVGTNYLVDGDGNSIVAAETGCGKTFRLVYEAVCKAQYGRVLIMVDRETDAQVMHMISMVMDYLNIDKVLRNHYMIDIRTSSSNGVGHIGELQKAIEHTKDSDYIGVYIDLAHLNFPSLHERVIKLLGRFEPPTCICKQTRRQASVRENK